MLDMFHMVCVHKFYSILIILILVNNISLGNHAHLSSWCLRYGSMKWSLLQMFECLGNLFENFENLLRSSSLKCQVLLEPYDETSWKPYTHMLLVGALSFVKILWPLWGLFSCFHDQDTRTHQHPPCYAQLRSSIVPYLFQKIKLHTMCWSIYSTKKAWCRGSYRRQ
jgi:hypothetical protein